MDKKKYDLKFPEINYVFWLNNWTETIGNSGVYTNKNIEKYIQFNADINACTDEIFRLISLEDITKKDVLRVIDLIYSWGGKSGRMFYARKNEVCPREELETNDTIFNTYMEGVELARQGKSESIEKFKSITGIGSSYASKHSYFWSLNSSNPLIIIDSKIAGALGFKTINSLEKMSPYSETVQSFIDKSKSVFGEENPSKVERALFAFHNYYFKNDNSGWKNRDEYKDYTIAQSIADHLFESGGNGKQN